MHTYVATPKGSKKSLLSTRCDGYISIAIDGKIVPGHIAMGSTYLSLHYHVVFGTKERRPHIILPWRADLHAYLGGVIRGLHGVAESVGGVEDHIHLLLGLKATHALADVVREIKKATSIWVRDLHDPSFLWQEGYAAFTVSPTQTQSVRRYVEGQEEHHRKRGFLDELKAMLKRSGIQYDTNYLD